MNDSSPLPTLAYDAQRWPPRYQTVGFVLGVEARERDLAEDGTSESLPDSSGAERWRRGFLTVAPEPANLEFTDGGGRSAPEAFLRLWTEDARGAGCPPREAFQLSGTFTNGSLGVAVGANGCALVALSLFMHVADDSARIAVAMPLMGFAVGLVFAGIATLAAWLNFQSADALRFAPAMQRGFERRMRSRLTPSFWLASAAGTSAYAAFAWAVFAFAEALAR